MHYWMSMDDIFLKVTDNLYIDNDDVGFFL